MLPSDLQKALYDIASDNDEGVINVRNAQRKAESGGNGGIPWHVYPGRQL
jgi:hypothetical protein